MNVKSIHDSQRDADGNAAAFWGDRCKVWIESLKHDPQDQRAEEFAVAAAIYAGTCARLQLQGGAR